MRGGGTNAARRAIRSSGSSTRWVVPCGIARALGVVAESPVSSRDFTHFTPQPPAGSIELWMAGDAPGGGGQGTRSARPTDPMDALGAGLRQGGQQVARDLRIARQELHEIGRSIERRAERLDARIRRAVGRPD